MFHVVLMLSL